MLKCGTDNLLCKRVVRARLWDIVRRDIFKIGQWAEYVTGSEGQKVNAIGQTKAQEHVNGWS